MIIIEWILLFFLVCLFAAMLIGGIVFWCTVIVAIWRGVRELRR